MHSMKNNFASHFILDHQFRVRSLISGNNETPCGAISSEVPATDRRHE